jgi:hypothetical protein
MLDKVTTDAMFSTLNKINIKQNRVFLVCDKGPWGNFVKIIAYYSKKVQRVKHLTSTMMRLKVQARIVQNSNQTQFGETIWRRECSGCTLVSVHQQWWWWNWQIFLSASRGETHTINAEQYMTSYCTLHCLQLTLAVPAKTILGEGGMTEERECSKKMFYNFSIMVSTTCKITTRS